MGALIRQSSIPTPQASTSTPVVPIRNGPHPRLLLLLAAAAGVVGLLVFVHSRFETPQGLAPAGWLFLGLAGLLLGGIVAAFRKLSLGWTVALLVQLAAAVTLTLLATGPALPPASATGKPPARHSTRALDLAAGCPAISVQPLAWARWARCAWKAAGNAARQHSPIPPTTTRRHG